MQHEIGHNFGADHDRPNATPYSNRRFLDAYGYVETNADGESGQATVMSYPGERVPAFSQNGATYNGVSIGSQSERNVEAITYVAWEIHVTRTALRTGQRPPTTTPPTNAAATKTPSVATQNPTDTQTIAPSSKNTDSPISRNSTNATDPNNTSAAIAAPIAAAATIAAAIAAARNRKKIREKAIALKRKLHNKVKKCDTTTFKSGHTDALVIHTGEQPTTTAPVTFTPNRNTRQPPPPPQRPAQPMVNDNPIATQEFAKITASTPRIDIGKRSQVAEMRQKFENLQAPKSQVPPKKPGPPIPKKPNAGQTRSKRSPSL